MTGFLGKLEKGFESVKDKILHDDDERQQQQNNYGSNNGANGYNQGYGQQQAQYGQYDQPQGYGQQTQQYGSGSSQNVNGPFQIPFNGKMIPAERKSCRAGEKPLMLWTHGAGGGLNDDATQGFANGFAELAPIVVHEAQSNLENRVNCYRAVSEHEQYATYFGGRSMGSRTAATLATNHTETKAVVLVSYPLINNGELREQIMLDLPPHLDVLFMLGSKDPMNPCQKFEEVRARMKARSWVCIVQGAAHMMDMVHDHATKDMRRQTGRIAAEWLQHRDPHKRFMTIQMKEGKAVPGPWVENDRPSW